MFSAIVINEIRDRKTGQAYKVGDRVRVLLKSESEYIGTIEKISPDEFSLWANNTKKYQSFSCGDVDEKIIKLETIEKMRFAEPDENFLNHWSF